VIQHQAEQGIILVVDHSFHSSVSMLMLTRMIASVLYANENGVSPVGTFCGPVGPEHSEEFLHPFAFSFVKIFTQVVEIGKVSDLRLAIALRIIRYGESVGDLVHGTKVGYLFAGKVYSIIGDDGMKEPEATPMFCQRNLTICCLVTSKSGTALIHLVK